MDQITDVKIKPLEDSQYVTPITVHYKQNGQNKTWDLIKVHDSVSIIIYNITRKVLVLVKQFRPAAYFAGIPACDKQDSIDTDKYPGSRGLMLELCAGIVDKKKPLEEIAREEVLEECGYDIPLSCLTRVIAYRSAVGVCGDQQTLFYAEVTDDMRVNQGGGNPAEGEVIEVVEMSIADAKQYLQRPSVQSPGSCIFGLHWFLSNHS